MVVVVEVGVAEEDSDEVEEEVVVVEALVVHTRRTTQARVVGTTIVACTRTYYLNENAT